MQSHWRLVKCDHMRNAPLFWIIWCLFLLGLLYPLSGIWNSKGGVAWLFLFGFWGIFIFWRFKQRKNG